MSTLSGQRRALVTGGAGGIGAEICRRLSADGFTVAVADLDGDRAADVAAAVGGQALALDVADADAVAPVLADLVAKFGPLDACVNAAGWDELRPFLETDEAFQARTLEINLAGPMRVVRAVLPGMVEAGGGRIVNIASDAARVGSSLESVYSGAKGGLVAFTKTIAREFARYSITANAVCPGPTETPLLDAITEASEDGARVIAAMTKAVPMRRMGTPDDVAPAVVFLASDAAGYITGQTLSASGGLTMS